MLFSTKHQYAPLKIREFCGTLWLLKKKTEQNKTTTTHYFPLMLQILFEWNDQYLNQYAE